MEFKFDYKLTNKADFELNEIVQYIGVELGNQQAATNFVMKLENKIDYIRTFPEGGSPVYNEFMQIENVRKIVVNNYIVYYYPDIENKMIYILSIVYAKRNMDETLKSLKIR